MTRNRKFESKQVIPVFILLLLLSLSLYSQKNLPNGITKGLVFENIFTNNGLPDNRIRNIYQSKKGYLWIGTMNGLARYDGYTFDQYSKKENGEGISGNWVYAIAEDVSENIWVGTTEGLSKIVTSQGKTHNFSSLEYLTHKEVRALLIDSEQRVWIGTKLGLSIYDIKTGKIKKFIDQPFNNTINSIVQDTSGRVWMTCETGLISFKVDDLSYTYFPLKVKSNPYGDKMWDVYPINNEIWLGTGGDGIFRFDTKTLSSPNENLTKLSQLEKIVDGSEVFDIAQNSKGSIWIATGKGLGKVTHAAAAVEVEFFNHQNNNGYSISNDKLYKIHFDSSQNLWIGSDMGLSILLAKNLNFQNYNFEQNSMKDAVRGITSVDENNLLITTSSKGIYKVGLSREDTGKISIKVSNDRINLGRSITNLGQTVFVGTLDGILVKDLRSEKESHILSGKNIFSLAKDSLKSKVYIGATDGLYVYDQNDSQRTTKNPIINGFVRSLNLTKDGDLWVGVDGPEIFIKKRASKGFEKFRLPKNFHGREINAIDVDGSGNLWIGTQSGLNKISEDGRGQLLCEFIDESKGLIDKSVNGLLVDKKNNVWLSTIKGLTKYKPETGDFEYFLPDLIFSPSSFYEESDTSFIFGHSEGFVKFDPTKIFNNENSPNIQITALRISNKKIGIGDKNNGDVILKINIENTKEVILNHNNTIFTLEYADLNGNFDDNRMYAYKLDGFDEDWIFNIRNQHTATYTNLDSGSYSFKIRANTQEGAEYIKEMDITVLSPPWKTWWAILLYILVLNGIIFLFVRFRIENAKKENQLIWEKQEKEQIKELNNQKLEFFTNISHEFQNPVTLIAGPIRDIVNNTSISLELRKKAKIIEKNSDKLIYLIDELITFREIGRGYLKLKPKPLNLLRFAQETAENFQLFAEKKEVLISCNSLLSNNTIMADPLQFYKVINNLVANALKFCPANSVVKITISSIADKILSKEQKAIDNRWVSIVVSDQGSGIPEKHIAHLFDRFYKGDGAHAGTGIGLSLVKEIIELHRGSIKVKSEPGNTRFIVMLPKGKPEDMDVPVLKSAALYHQNLKPESLLMAETVDIENAYDNTFGDYEKKHILLVDDNVELLEYLFIILKQDYEITMAPDGIKALELIAKKRPDLVVSDVIMPKMDGFQLCERIKDNFETANIPIILLTAKTMAEGKLKGLKLGAEDYLDKPFDPEILKARINSVLKNRSRLLKTLGKGQNFIFSELDRNPIDEKFIQDVINHVNENLENEDFSVEELSDNMAMSRSNLFRKLKLLTKMSPVEFIYYIRLQRSLVLLLERKYSISEIAWRVGYKNPSSFSKSFKKQYGKSPSEYLSDRIKDQ